MLSTESRVARLAPFRRYLRKRYGLWPMYEWKNRAVGALGALWLRRFEDREVARLRAVVGPAPRATCASVIPTFRRPEQLHEAVESALTQTLTDHVVIVVDDGGGLPALPRHPRLYAVSLSRNTEALGVVRNVGIRLTQSTYVAFLDDDNRWRPHHLESAIAAHEREGSSTPLVYMAMERWRLDGTPVDVLSRPFDRAALLDGAGFIDASTMVVRRDSATAFSRIRRRKHTRPKEDWVLAYRLSGNGGRVVHVPEVTVDYRIHDGSYYTDWPTGLTSW